MQAKLKSEEKASGIDVESSELDCLLEEILEKEKAGKEKLECEEKNKKKTVEKDKAAAEDMCKKALERMGQTAKRKRQVVTQKCQKKKRVEGAQLMLLSI